MNKLIQLPASVFRLVLIVLPMLLYAGYLGLIAADRFVSDSVVSVRQDNGSASEVPGAAMLLAGFGSPSHTDTLYLREYMHSQNLILKLEDRLSLRAHFAAAGADYPFKLSAHASTEDFVSYFRDRVEVIYDDRASLLHLRVQGFAPAFSQQLNQAILDASEQFVNEASHRIARERLRFADGELERAGQRLKSARADLLAFQNKHQLLDPMLAAQASGVLSNELEASRSRLEAELNGLLGFLNEGAYQVKALRGQIAALNQQIRAEQSRATTGGKQGARLNQLALEFQGLELQASFAGDAYKLALGAVENARIDATRKIKSLVVVEPPSLPETAEYPRVIYNLATLFAVCVLLYAVVRLVVATIREHMD